MLLIIFKSLDDKMEMLKVRKLRHTKSHRWCHCYSEKKNKQLENESSDKTLTITFL